MICLRLSEEEKLIKADYANPAKSQAYERGVSDELYGT
jgi:hypothetical protein